MSTEIISDAEIAGFMNWRGPGAYTQHQMKRVRRVVTEADRRIRARYVALDTELAQLYEAALNQARTIRAKQAEIDRLMWEYCPSEMTPEQIAEWERHQAAVVQP